MADVKPHWLAPGGKTKTPRIIVTFDTETTERNEDKGSVQVLRCWHAIVRDRRPVSKARDGVRHHQGERATDLVAVVEAAAQRTSECWVIAHNVGFDLAVTSLPFILAEHGWAINGVHLGKEACWWSFTKGGHSIVITDSWSWLRCSLVDAAKDVKRRKVRLPADDDSLEAWHRRCRSDVEILDALMMEIMNWWDRSQLGVFGITGAACGWRTMRSMVKPKALLVGPDGERTAFERRAVFGGRKEVYGVGKFHDPWIADYDFAGAYPTTTAACPLPSAPAKKWTTTAKLLRADPPPQRDYLAEVEITTHVPCAPVRIGHEVWWPVGTFRTVLAGPEIRYALTVADSVKVIHWEAYKTSYALAEWAAWCLKIQNAPESEVPPVVARVAKGWGRSVLGRFAARTSHVIATRPATHLGWHLETGHDLTTGAALEYLSMNGIEQTIAKDQDGNDVFPAVFAFVEAYTRVALARMMATRDPRNLLQCNTDGWWEMRAVRLNDHVPDNVPWPHRVVRKALVKSLTVIGPNHVMTPNERRYAGVPSTALTTDNNSMVWRDWPGLRWQLEYGSLGEYHRPAREVTLAEHYARRWVLDTGETVPVTMTLNADHSPRIEPWVRSWGQLPDDVLAPYQVPTLVKVNESDTDPGTNDVEALPLQPGRGFRYTPRGGRRKEPRLDLIERLERNLGEAKQTPLPLS